jgi:phosphoribosylformimino-5-aminoimidazole carboxamide ribotide isomerase
MEGRLATAFEILPAIDLRGGRVVRLQQGDFDRETEFSDDPAAVARAFVAAGARWLHVVDLDGARTGEPAHTRAIQAVVSAVGDRAAVEVAGGLRTEASVGAVLATGARRAIVGTAALRDPAFAGGLVATHDADRIGVAIDVRDGRALGDGWRAGASGMAPEEAVARLLDAGVTLFEATAIDRDGLLGGPDLDLLTRLVARAGGRGSVIASGGVSSMDDLRAIRELGCSGAIVGRALYEARLDLAEAIRG